MSTFHPIFVVGPPRSGTTLLAACMDRHTRIGITPETRFFIEVYPLLRKVAAPASHEALLDVFLANRRIQDLNLTKNELMQIFRDRDANAENLLQTALEVYVCKRGKVRCGEKTTKHLYYVSTILEWYPEAKIIGIIRDGRDMVLSLQRVPWTHSSLVRHCLTWKARASEMQKLCEQYPTSFYVVRYEDLLRYPERELRRLCTFVGEQFEMRQLLPEEESEVVPEWEKEWKGKVNSSFDTSRIGAWESNASNYEQTLMHDIMTDMLKHWGYDTNEEKYAWWIKRLVRLRTFPFHPAVLPLMRLGKSALAKCRIRFKATQRELDLDVPLSSQSLK